MQARAPGVFGKLARLATVLLWSWPFLVSADPPKVCGNDAALGNFAPASCPVLKDDGLGADAAAGDGIYSVEVMLSQTALLEYKVLPTGTFDGTQLGQSGDCDVSGMHGNMFGNIQVPAPDTSRPVRFFYDSRSLVADPTYATAPANRSSGDDLMQRSPAAHCPRWLAIGDFQSSPFDRTAGVVELTLQAPGVLFGRLTAAKALASGWHWKILEAAAAGTARRYGPSGFADEPCDTDNATVSSAVNIGDIIYFTWHSAGGRLQTVVRSPGDELPDGGGSGSLPLCPAPADDGDMGVVTDLGGGRSPDASALGDGGNLPLPGIHCNYGHGVSERPRAATSFWGAFGLAALYLTARGRRLTRRPRGSRGCALPTTR